MNNKRGNVWIAAAGLVINEAGEWLVVKKKYSGLKGKWSLPAGFVQPGEMLDEAAVREVKEETGIDAEPVAFLGLRTGVINEEISDNMAIFLLRPRSKDITVQKDELHAAAFLSKEALSNDPATSGLIRYLLALEPLASLSPHDGLNPGDPFGYTKYRLYFKSSKYKE
ncbi:MULTISPECIES: NUDIX domain-containing protein [Geobacillus]|jgi:8-oxo-dGTP diphosphatase|uniref:MutT/nudix family protein n=1 Tax=Geobacillus thermodenitrificans (strain NG80-2) TaxID=420246 RepID=A4ISE4_GEOTN|nr:MULTISPECIES: NUDIX domain-containing protein [Geobacillus]ABO68248.1 MutT/nudix family protein [Geobacillus thermodenitrificans NG80-2]ATO38000.1 NUDIX hydrolase [Geobacillus thermodenitrificans]MED0662987.1 NUDIX domain-containing protein [Geobacillus thermodenitrificans]MED3717953.1 NUDIX domain-containing protein [Geobacillus thermodenitrificans]MED4917680.1 NUDIX domain-containing protein [Geobacillus thermodenitrificans]